MSDWYEFISRLDGRRMLKRKVFTVCGTGVDMWTGYPADVARATARFFDHQPVAYPAAVFPMGASADEGIAELERLLADPAQGIGGPDGAEEWVMIGYSQGAIVTSTVYKRMVSGDSPVAWALPRLKAAITYGNPCREKGVANGNAAYGWDMPGPNTRGIAETSQRLVDTPDWWYDFVNRGDIYTEVEDDDVGEDMTMVYKMVQDPIAGFGDLGTDAVPTDAWNLPGGRLDGGNDTLVEQLAEIMTSPLAEFPAAISAIINGLGFVAAPGGPTFPHVSYSIAEGIDYLRRVGEKLPVALGRDAA